MARVQLGAMVTGLKGSISGWTFHDNRSGLIVRSRSGTGKAGTPKQFASRQIVGRYNQLWQALSLADQLSWNDFADAHTRTTPFGDVRSVSGSNWHQSINYNRTLCSVAYIPTPPVYTLPTSVPGCSMQITTTKIFIVFDAPFEPSDNAIEIWSTSPMTRVSTSLRSRFRFTVLVNSSSYTSIDITSEWNTAHGLDWATIADTGKLHLGAMVQTIQKNSGISSPGRVVIAGYDHSRTGIGYMMIGSTFIIS